VKISHNEKGDFVEIELTHEDVETVLRNALQGLGYFVHRWPAKFWCTNDDDGTLLCAVFRKPGECKPGESE
jgi:hypothetical protein